MERSTVDFIVPGEMELTSAVRSVSCGSTINKCNGSVPPSAMASNSAASKALLPHNKVSSYLFTFVCLLFSGGSHKYALDPEEYIFAALNIYLDVINLFMYLVMIIAALGGDD